MKKLVALLAVLGLASMASAAMQVVVDPGVNVGTGLTSYTIRLVSATEADMPYAFDGSIVGTPGLSQQKDGLKWTPVLDSVLADAGFDPVKAAKDTHFTFLRGDYFDPSDPENTGVYATQILGIVSLGENATSLYGKFGFCKPDYDLNEDPAGQPFVSQNMTFAQVVLADGASAVLTGEFADALGNKTMYNVAIPEPATLGLLAIGALGLIRRKLA